VFPVKAKTHFGAYHHDYPAVDIFAPCGSTAVAPVSGTVDEVARTDKWHSTTDKGADRGGLSVSIIGVDGVRYYGSHLRKIAAGISSGRTVTAGQEIGHVGNTGDARGIACHLHFGISPDCGRGDWWNRRGTISPYRFLKAWQAGRNISPKAAVKTWKAAHGCPKAPTSDP
jgi:murein DD-endopeptidase MepM/ murein hydrolase activator NlpD